MLIRHQPLDEYVTACGALSFSLFFLAHVALFPMRVVFVSLGVVWVTVLF